MALKPKLPLAEPTFVAFKKAVEASRKETREKSKLWKANIDATFGDTPKEWEDDGAIKVNRDYPRSRQLISQLFFRTPEVQSKPLRPGSADVAPIVAAAINQKLREMGVSFVVDEVLTDTVVSAGIGGAMVDYEAITQEVEVKPAAHQQTPDEVFAGLVESGAAAYETAQVPTYESYVFRRIAPESLISPADFDGSRWDDAAFVGEEFSMPAAEARRVFKLSAEDIKKVVGRRRESLSGDELPESSFERVNGYTLYYRACFYDHRSPHKDLIRKLVYFDGLEKPVVHEDYHGQRYANGELLGVRRYPIRPLTKVFVPGRPIPPSDVTITRPQVKELSKGRTLQMLQRERSLPIRWMDINMVDEATENLLQEGQVQTFIPFNGPATNAIGEIARATYPRESFEFDRALNQEIADAWGLTMPSTPQGEQTAEEIRESTAAATTRLDYDRTKVLRWFIECVEVLFGLMQLYADQTDYAELVGPDGAQQLVAWNKENLKGYFALEARPDAALRLDAAADRQQALNLFQLLGNDPFIDRRSLLQEVLRTHNLSDSKVLLPQPPEPQPERPSVSFRFSGEDLDVTRPSALMVFDILRQCGMQVPPEVIQQARDQAARTLALAAANPAMALADTMRLDYRGVAPGASGPAPQPENPGAVTQVEPLNKTQLTEARVK